MTKWRSNDFLYVKLRTRLDTIPMGYSFFAFVYASTCRAVIPGTQELTTARKTGKQIMQEPFFIFTALYVSPACI